MLNLFSPAQAITAIVEQLKMGRESFLTCTLNLDHLVKLRRDPDFRTAYRQARFVMADGFPIVLLARLRGHTVKRTTGSDLVLPLCQVSAELRFPVYFLGSTPETLAKVSSRLGSLCPGLEISGMRSPDYGFDPSSREADEIATEIGASGARLCFVALGAPLQERFSTRAMMLVQGVCFLGVGASLDFLSGKQRRAPRLLQILNLEWAWRLVNNPHRLWLRYARCGLLFVNLLWREIFLSQVPSDAGQN